MSSDEYEKALNLIDMGSTVAEAQRLLVWSTNTHAGEFTYSEMQLTVDVIEKLLLAIVIAMHRSGCSSFECPESIIRLHGSIIRLHGWRKK